MVWSKFHSRCGTTVINVEPSSLGQSCWSRGHSERTDHLGRVCTREAQPGGAVGPGREIPDGCGARF